jgi:hypothetical protein
MRTHIMSAEGFIEVLDVIPYGTLFSDSVHGVLKFVVPGAHEQVEYLAPLRSEMSEDLYEKFVSDVDNIWRHRTGRSIL